MGKLLSDIQMILTLACQDTSRLVSESMDRRLPWAERLAVMGHLLVCKSCRRFRRQLMLLRESARRYEQTLTEDVHRDSAVRLSDEARRRISDALSKTRSQRDRG